LCALAAVNTSAGFGCPWNTRGGCAGIRIVHWGWRAAGYEKEAAGHEAKKVANELSETHLRKQSASIRRQEK